MNRIKIPLLSFGLWRHQERWRLFFSDAEVLSMTQDVDSVFVLGWGRKRSGKRAENIAKKSVKYQPLYIEDGFLRSMDLGVNGDDPLSLVVDDLGIYYDTTKTSRLEQMILDQSKLQPFLQSGEKALAAIVAHKLTKYNHVAEGWPSHLAFDESKRQVLIIDQTFGDMSLVYGNATEATFREMVLAAKRENPDSQLWIKIHPDVLTGKKQGYLTDFLADERISLLSEDIHPHSLLERMDSVYVATSQMGFEALMLGKKVVTFGLPWYAGWGLTDDRNTGIPALKNAGRRREATLLELFSASYLQYCRYINPFTQQRGTIFDVIDYLVMMKRRQSLLQGEIWCVGLSWWKRRIILPFLQTTNNRLRFFKDEKALRSAYQARLNRIQNAGDNIHKKGDNAGKEHEGTLRLLLWGVKFPALADFAVDAGIPILRMEDGFIRSVGLGSNLVPPRSLVIDDLGIYFDSSKPSRLEAILQTTAFSAAELQAATELQTALIEKRIGKYNVGVDRVELLTHNGEQKIILVPGQVEDDASIKTGTRDIQTNLALLMAVRAANLDAYIIYKPHPDVISGNRLGQMPDNIALQYADEVMAEADILALIERSDEIHTMTSLSGFEALLRGKTVHCYGLPFYAGWGLTHDLHLNDRHIIAHRSRKLTLTELICGTLILYPSYLDPVTGKLTSAMSTLDALAKERALMANKGMIHANFSKRKLQQLKGLIQTFTW